MPSSCYRKNVNSRARKYISLGLLVAFLLLIMLLGASGCSAPASSDVKKSGLSDVQTTASNNQTSTPPSEGKTTTSGSKGILEVHFLDVGQADAILVLCGEQAMLVDAGNNDDADLVEEYLSRLGIKRLDYVVGTHPHEDHIGGLDAVISDFEIGQVLLPRVTANTRTFDSLVSTIKEKNLRAKAPAPGTTFMLGQALCTVLAPNKDSYENLNDYSIVLLITFGQNSFLLMGDAGQQSEEEIMGAGRAFKADVFKVGHHGSRSSTSEEFLDRVNPQYAVISVGACNDYGHPHRETLARLRAHGTTVYRTDQCGTIVAVSDGQKISFDVR